MLIHRPFVIRNTKLKSGKRLALETLPRVISHYVGGTNVKKRLTYEYNIFIKH
jgi:hypothetical protein